MSMEMSCQPSAVRRSYPKIELGNAVRVTGAACSAALVVTLFMALMALVGGLGTLLSDEDAAESSSERR